MKKLIRKCVFETNSSSSHSISLSTPDKEFIMDTIYPDQFGKVYVDGGEFGWEWRKYNDAQTKLNYAYQDRVSPELLKKVVMEQTGATDVVFGDLDKGYVDHQSYGTASELCKDEESTRNFIFNKNSWLFTGNDNGTPDPTFFHVPVFQTGKVINPVYTYELSIKGLEKTTKFINKPTDEELEDGITSLTEGILMAEDGYIFQDTDIYFQISRPRNLFERSYRIDHDYSEGYILMIREGGATHKIEERLEKETPGYKKLNWKERNKILQKEILKDETLYRKLPFTLSEIK